MEYRMNSSFNKKRTYQKKKKKKKKKISRRRSCSMETENIFRCQGETRRVQETQITNKHL